MDSALNSIHSRQNEEPYTDYLAAAFYYDTWVKRTSAAQMILTVLVPVVLSAIAINRPGFSVWAALYGVGVAVADAILLDDRQEYCKKKNARFLELLDTELLGIRWHEFKAGKNPQPQEWAVPARKFRQRGHRLHRLKNWYSGEIGKLPPRQARLMCQRTNIWWPMEMRRGYIFFLRTLLILLPFAVIGVGVSRRLQLEQFILALLVPMFPAALWLIREMKKQVKCFDNLEKINGKWLAVWERTLDNEFTDEEYEQSVRDIQDDLYDHICSHPPVFEVIHAYYEKDFEEVMNKEIKHFVQRHQASERERQRAVELT